jgi:hypothetical protein
MADNLTALANTGTGTDVLATDEIAGVHYPRTKITIGADGVNDGDVSSANPLPVSGPVTDAQLRASAVPIIVTDPSTAVTFGPIATAHTVLFTAVDTANEGTIQVQLTGRFDRGGVYFEASNDNVNFHPVPVSAYGDDQLVEVVYSPELITAPVVAKYFRCETTVDFAGSVSGTYVLRNMDAPQRFTNTKLVDAASDILFPVAGVTPTGHVSRIRVAENGGILPADTTFTGSRTGAQVGTILMVDTTGYNSVAMQLANVFTGTVTFQASNDGSTWASVLAWPSAGGTAPVTTATAVGQWLIPAAGRFIRAQLTTAGSGFPMAIATLKNAAAFYPASTPSVTIAANSSVNIAQVGGTATAAGGLPILASGATSGASVGTLIAAGTNNLTQIKGTIGRLYFFHVRNQVASIRYVKLFNLPSASVTMGTTAATMNFMVPASGELNLPIPSVGLNMGGTGISFALVTGEGLTNNVAVTASDLIVNYSWA